MPETPITAFGRLSMSYSAFGKPHEFRVYVPEFGTDPTVGTFTASGSPASLDALATELSSRIGDLYTAAADLEFGQWLGERHTGGDSFVAIVNGTITAGTITPVAPSPNQPGAVSQATWTFRDSSGKRVRMVNLGQIYPGSQVFRYGGLGGEFLAFANYMLANARILSRSALPITSMVSLTFDTNDGLTRRYRRG